MYNYFLVSDVKKLFKDLRFIALSVLLITIIALGIAIYAVEHNLPNSEIKTLSDAFWWLIVTISTVGYGDVIPMSSTGKVLGSLAIIVGVALFTTVTGSVASLLVERSIKKKKGLGNVRMKDHTVILGKNDNLNMVLESLVNYGRKKVVVVSDMDESEFESIQMNFPEIELDFVKGDFTKDQTLRRASINSSSSVVILADSSSVKDPDEKTLIAILAVRSISPSVRIIAEVVSEDKAKHISRAGADKVIRYGEFNPFAIGMYASYPAIYDLMYTILKDGRMKMENIPGDAVGKSFKEVFSDFKRDGKLILGIVIKREKSIFDDIETGDETLDEFIKKKLEEAGIDVSSDEMDCEIKLNPPDDYEIGKNDVMFVCLE